MQALTFGYLETNGGHPLGTGHMALGAMMLSMPAAMLGAFYFSVLRDLGAVEAFALYAVIGSISLMIATLVNGLSQD